METIESTVVRTRKKKVVELIEEVIRRRGRTRGIEIVRDVIQRNPERNLKENSLKAMLRYGADQGFWVRVSYGVYEPAPAATENRPELSPAPAAVALSATA